MKLNDFERYIDNEVLKRGRDYFEKGRIESLFDHEGRYFAKVRGRKEYSVLVRVVGQNTIMSVHCNCPYDWGVYCKHEVAVLYAMREKMNIVQQVVIVSSEKESLEDVLNKLDKNTLVSELLKYAERNLQIRDELMLSFSSEKNKEIQAREIVATWVKNSTFPGLTQCDSVQNLTAGAAMVLDLAEERKKEETLFAIGCCMMVIEEMAPLICGEDSDSQVEFIIDGAIALLDDALMYVPSDGKNNEEIFARVMELFEEDVFDHYDEWRIDLIGICAKLYILPESYEKVENRLSELECEMTGITWNEKYYLEKIHVIRYGMICRALGKESADKFLEEHIEDLELREMVIQAVNIDKN